MNEITTVSSPMEIKTATSSSPLIRLRVPVSAINALPFRSGQEVTAIVRSSDASGNLTLDINGKLLRAITSLPLLQGMSVKLSVEQENRQLLLRVPPQEQQRLLQQQALRQWLPRQDSIKPLMEHLAKLLPQSDERPVSTGRKTGTAIAEAPSPAGRSAVQQGTAMEQIQKLAQQLLRHTPSPQVLGEAKGLQQAILHSGIFLEHQLGTATPGSFRPDSDIKVLLLRLAALIRQTLANPADKPASGKAADTAQAMRQVTMETLMQLQKQTEASLARIQVNQLGNTATASQGEDRPLLIELPVFNPQQQQTEILQLKIQREKNRSGDRNKDCWSLTLHMNPAEYGEIQAIVSLSNGKVSVTFWCAEAGTRELFREKLELLTQRLQEQGLEVSRCNAHQGLPSVADKDTAVATSTLIDIKA